MMPGPSYAGQYLREFPLFPPHPPPGSSRPMALYIPPNASNQDPSGLFHCFARGRGKGATVGINVVEADGPKAGRFCVLSGQTVAGQNPPLSAVPQKRTKEPRRKPPAAREMGPLSQLKFREFLQ